MIIIFLNTNKFFIKVLLLELLLLLTLMYMKRVLVDPNTIYASFTGKVTESPNSMYSSNFC